MLQSVDQFARGVEAHTLLVGTYRFDAETGRELRLAHSRLDDEDHMSFALLRPLNPKC